MKKIITLSFFFALVTSFSFADCPDVTGLTATSLNGTDVQLSWDAMPGATQYQLKVEQEETATPFIFWLSLSDNTYLLEGLAPDGIYKFKVRTICGGEKASWSEFQFFTGSSGTGSSGSGGDCQIPDQLTAMLDAAGNAQLAWAGVTNAIIYEVEVESEENTPFVHLEFNTTENFAELTGLVAGGTYKFKVKSKCGGSNSSEYSAWTFFGGGINGGGNGGNGGGTGSTCDTPAGLTVSDINSGSALISWDAVAGAQGYEVQVEDDENTPAFNWETIETGTQVIVTGLAPGGNYQVKVKTKCEGGNNSPNSDWVFFSTINFTGNDPQMLSPEQEGSSQAYKLSPNPAYSGEQLTIAPEQTQSSEKIWIGIYDQQGRLQRSLDAYGGMEQMQIPTAGLRVGMYQVVIRSDQEIQTRRFSLLE